MDSAKHKLESIMNLAQHDVAPPASVLNPEALVFCPSRRIVCHSVSATCSGDAPKAAELIRGFWDVFIDSVATFAWDALNRCKTISSMNVPPLLMYRWTAQQIIEAACCPGCLCEVTGARCYSCACSTKNAFSRTNVFLHRNILKMIFLVLS